MGRVIQMIKISDENSMFLTDFDEKTNELSFRVAYEPKQPQKEIVAFVEDKVKTNLYFFHKWFLEKFLHENKN